MNIAIIDSNFESDAPEREVLEAANMRLIRHQCLTQEEMISAGKDAVAVLVQYASIDRHVMEAWNSCKLIVRYGIGYDNVDIRAAEELGIAVCNVPFYCLDEVADHTCALILAGLRKIVQFHESVIRGEWEVERLAKPMPRLAQLTLGLVGFGRIGAGVAERMRSFRFRIRIYDPYLDDRQSTHFGIEKAASLEQLLSAADVLSLHTPLTKETKRLINSETLSRMKPSAWIVNTSRGGLIDTEALAGALSSRRIGGAALDVFEEEPLPPDHPLRACANVIFTPHAAYYSDQSLKTLQRQAAEEIVRWAEGKPLLSQVNRS